jgi:hypothetical protein
LSQIGNCAVKYFSALSAKKRWKSDLSWPRKESADQVSKGKLALG